MKKYRVKGKWIAASSGYVDTIVMVPDNYDDDDIIDSAVDYYESIALDTNNLTITPIVEEQPE